jgi:tellurite resistance protein TerC
VIVAVIGVTVLAIGVAMILLPGPATVVIPLGLGILAIEFAWAARMLKRLKDQANRVFGRRSP